MLVRALLAACMSMPLEGRIDVEFSAALHDKTGKYFIGRDLIEGNRDLTGRQLFGRFSFQAVPVGLRAKVAGRLLALEVNGRAGSRLFDRAVPRRRPPRPVLHTDPYSVLIHRLSRGDLVLCHDVGPLTHPDLFDAAAVTAYRKIYGEIAAAGPHMVFVSQASRDAFHALFPGDFASSRVIYPPVRKDISTTGEEPVPGVAAPFLLSVGSLGARKNQKIAIEAFSRSGLAAQGVRYVLCGGSEPGHEAVLQAAASTEGVIALSYVSDGALRWLYSNASGFVLTSLLEGFGIPVAEAIAHGLIPIVSRNSVLQEVAGHGAFLVDPCEPLDIAQAMAGLMRLPEPQRQERKEKLGRSVARFTLEQFLAEWRDTLAMCLFDIKSFG